MIGEKYESVIGGTYRRGGSATVQEVRRASDHARFVAKTLGIRWDTAPVLREINDLRQGLIPDHARWFVEVEDWCFVPSTEDSKKQQLRLFMPWCQPLDEIVMRRVSNGFLDRPPTSDEQRRQRLGWVADLAIGMELLHAAGTLHSDAHISNAFVDSDLRARWGDLGAGDFYETISGPVGHPSSCAPSVWPDADCRAADDLYSLAHTAATILSGSRPHVALKKEKDLLPPPVTRWPSTAQAAGLPPALDAVIARAGAWEREDRHSDALPFVRELLDAAGHSEIRSNELIAAAKTAEEVRLLVSKNVQVRQSAPARDPVQAPVLDAVLAAQADLQRAVAQRDREIEQLQVELGAVRAQLERRSKRPIRSLFIRNEPPWPRSTVPPQEAPAAYPVRASAAAERQPSAAAGALEQEAMSQRASRPREPVRPSRTVPRTSTEPAGNPLFAPAGGKAVRPQTRRRPRGRGPLGAYVLHRYVLAQIDWCTQLIGDLLDDTHRTWSIWELDGDNAERCGRDELVGFLAYLDAWTTRETRGRTVRPRRPAWRRRRALITQCNQAVPDDYDVRRACSEVHETLQAVDPALRTPGRLAPLILRGRLADQLDRMSDGVARLADAHRQLPTLLRLQRIATIVKPARELHRTASSDLRSNGAASIPYCWEPDELQELSEIVLDRWDRDVGEVPDQDALEHCEALVAELRIPPDRIAGIDSPSLWVASARQILHHSKDEMDVLTGLPAAVRDSGHEQRVERRKRLTALLANFDSAPPRELRDVERQADNLSLECNGLKRAQNRAADHLLGTLTNIVKREQASAAGVRLKQLCAGLASEQQKGDERADRGYDSDGNSVSEESWPLPRLSSSAAGTIGILLCATLDGATLRERLRAGGSETDKEMLAAFDVAEGAIIRDPSQHWRLLDPLVKHRRATIAQAACLILYHSPNPEARAVAFQALFCAALTGSRGYRTGAMCRTSADENAALTVEWESLLDPLRELAAHDYVPLSTATVERVIASFGDSSDAVIAAMDIELIQIDRAEAKLRTAPTPQKAGGTAPSSTALLELAWFLGSVRADPIGAIELRRKAFEQPRRADDSLSTTDAWNLARAGRQADAESVFERAIREAETPDTLCEFARFNAAYGDRDKAESLFRKAMEMQQGAPLVGDHCLIAFARFLAGDADRRGEARVAFERAFEASSWPAGQAFSRFLASIGEVDEAEAVLIAATSHIAGPWTYLDHGEFLATVRHNPAAALDRCERVCETSWPKRDPAVAANYAELLLISGATDRGEALALRVLRQVAENSHFALAMQTTRAILGPPAVRAEARERAEQIARAGVNAEDWDFSNLYARVESSDDASWLNRFLS